MMNSLFIITICICLLDSVSHLNAVTTCYAGFDKNLYIETCTPPWNKFCNKFSYNHNGQSGSYHYCSAGCTDGPGILPNLPNVGVGLYSCCTTDNCNHANKVSSSSSTVSSTSRSSSSKVSTSTSKNQDCGSSFYGNNLDFRIVGGLTAVAHSWPSISFVIFNYKGLFQVGFYEKLLEFKGACGGTLISSNVVLTAAHCIPKTVTYYESGNYYEYKVKTNTFYPTMGSMFKVYLGLHDKWSLDFDGSYSDTTIEMQVSKVVVHQNYSETNLQNDIALLILKNHVTFNNYIQPACLPSYKSNTYPSTNLPGYIAGWGAIYSGDITPDKLKNAKIDVYDALICKKVTDNLNLGPITYGQICAGDVTGKKDTCQGDSGGPLYVLENSKHVVAGITSYGIGCATEDYAGVYTRVSHYLDWISDNSNNGIKLKCPFAIVYFLIILKSFMQYI